MVFPPVSSKPHAVCIPFPLQGHINAMLKLAKLLHCKGFHITFVNTEFNHKRLLKSRGPNALDGLLDFQFESIPDGLPPSDIDASQDIPALCESASKNCLAPFQDLLGRLNSSEGSPPVTCIVSDGAMSSLLKAAEELGIPAVLFWPCSPCGFLGFMQFQFLIDKGIIPLKECERAAKASAIFFNTFDEFDRQVLSAFSSMLSPVYAAGPLQLLLNHYPQTVEIRSITSNLWKEDPKCLQWLNSKEPKSVVYVNFGSVTVVTAQQLVEFAWGLADSKQSFLWIIRPDLVRSDSALLPPEFLKDTKDRSLMASWCPQEEVLKHPAIGGFLTHCGWNSTIGSVGCGLPIVCWPFFADQQTTSWFACSEWGIGMEIDSNVRREDVEKLVRELMEGGKGRKMRKKAEEWKRKAEEATSPGGPSFLSLDRLINEVLLQSNCSK